METRERFTIRITDREFIIHPADRAEDPVRFSPVEALMLLDILNDAKAHLREMADRDMPLPFSVRFSRDEADS